MHLKGPGLPWGISNIILLRTSRHSMLYRTTQPWKVYFWTWSGLFFFAVSARIAQRWPYDLNPWQRRLYGCLPRPWHWRTDRADLRWLRNRRQKLWQLSFSVVAVVITNVYSLWSQRA